MGEGGTLIWALGERPGELDPLLAASPGEALLSRQIHEPLVESVTAPFERGRRLPGLALSARPSSDATVWRVRLRQGIRFGDGAHFDAGAVLANAERWEETAPGRRALPDLLAVDAPRPDLVRFILRRPNPHLDRRLRAAQLGIVSPRALRRAGDTGVVRAQAGTGTGPFELREQSRERVLLARNTAWWGSELELGPALDQLEFLVVADPGERLAMLAAGSAQVAGELGRGELGDARDDPLLSVVGHGLAAERSVRGLDPGTEPPMLNDVWTTAIAPG